MINIRPNDLDRYFEIRSLEELFEALPSGYVGSGVSRKVHRRLFDLSMSQPYNPYPDHAGHTLQASLTHQWDDPELRPPGYDARIAGCIERLA